MVWPEAVKYLAGAKDGLADDDNAARDRGVPAGLEREDSRRMTGEMGNEVDDLEALRPPYVHVCVDEDLASMEMSRKGLADWM